MAIADAIVLIVLLCIGGMRGLAAADRVDFAATVNPLLSDRCFTCHGPDDENRQAELRLDSAEGISGTLPSDPERHVTVPGRPDQSELISRIMSTDPDVMMPPPDSRLTLSDSEKSLLKQWVTEGAEWHQHWAFVRPRQAELPAVAPVDDSVATIPDGTWCRNEIDRFVLARMQAANLQPAVPADREMLIRRATFDLTGLPPTLAEIDAFVSDQSANAFETVVDRLLASPQYGERMAAEWLDVARYSDTYGYQVDRDRFVWPWRDWVIRAFNQNMPGDQFILEQIAGDLLPDATQDQILATTFNRLHPQKVEGGSVPEEFRNEYVADRTQTVGTAFLGLTLECCKCHDHKYDPLPQREFYQLYAYFNTIDEFGLYSYFTNSVPTPTLQLTSAAQQQQLTDAKQRVAAAEQKFAEARQVLLQQMLNEDGPLTEVSPQQLQALQTDDATLIPGRVASLSFEEESQGANASVTGHTGRAVRLTGDHAVDVKVGNFTRWQPFTVSLWMTAPKSFERAVVFHRSRAWTDAGSRGYELLIEDGRLSAALVHFWPGNAIRVRSLQRIPINEWMNVTVTWDGSTRAEGLSLWMNGRRLPTEVVRDNLYKEITGGGGDTINIGERFRDTGFSGGTVDEFQVFERQLTEIEIRHLFDGQTLRTALRPADGAKSVDDNVRRQLAEYVVDTLSEPLKSLRSELAARRKEWADLQNATQEIMVMAEMAVPRQTHVLLRGAYDKPGEMVSAGLPAVLAPPALSQTDHGAVENVAGTHADRLQLARWLISPEHPLTARVTVNRMWQMLFGQGIVRTPEDFGSQGTAPSHPQLLDWLTVDFQQHGWNVRRLQKQMMLSATYQQSSVASPVARSRDPDNVWLSHASVFRLPAEMVRDNALAVSGLLNQQIGGPPAKPYELAESFKPTTPDADLGLYRRSLYTYWKRTSPAPMMMTLDSSSRDVCRLRRERTSSPLQGLVIMNSPQFVEASRVLADRLIALHGDNDDAVGRQLFRLMTSRHADEQEASVIAGLFAAEYQNFQASPESAQTYLSVGKSQFTADDRSRLAAWAVVANTLMAYDGTLMRR